jgi:hypothetical protein
VRTVREGGRRTRLWYDADEIEQIVGDALRTAGLWCGSDAGSVDIERLLEVHLGAVVDYAGDLDRTTLGYTVFESPPRVVVSRTLTELAHAPSATLGLRGRWRATLAHEAAHILLHARLYDRHETPRSQPSVRCLRSEIEAGGGARDWREVQANMGMAALLMPRQPFLAEARRILSSGDPVFPPVDATVNIARRLIGELAKTFETSHQAARLRLAAFGFISS